MKMRGHPARQVHVTDSILNCNFLESFVALYTVKHKSTSVYQLFVPVPVCFHCPITLKLGTQNDLVVHKQM